MSPALADRANMLAASRSFFAERGVMEVDCPSLTALASVDLHIDLFTVEHSRYLHSSPEYGMKRLLALGFGDIYQLSHVFRKGEAGPYHNPEFMMTEWYRLNFRFEEMIDESCDYIDLFLGKKKRRTLTYRQAARSIGNYDPFNASDEDLKSLLDEPDLDLDRDSTLQLLFTKRVEPHLGQNELTVIIDFPASQAALSTVEGEVAKRFEIYSQSRELANGYKELTDPIEQKKRLEKANQERIRAKKNALPIDMKLIGALEEGLPPCCGVAIGFDRLMMLRRQAVHIKEVIPFSWKEA